MTRRELPKHVYLKKGVPYFVKRGLKTVRMTSTPGTPEFAVEYARVLSGRAPAPTRRSLKALAMSYQDSRRFKDLAPRTKADYMQVLDYVKDKLGHLPYDQMQRKDVIRAQESNAKTVRFANYIVQVLRVMFEHSIDKGWRADNPAKGISLIKSDRPKRLPWPPHLIKHFRDAAPMGSRQRIVFELLLGTGQRIGDVLRMSWNDIEDGGVKVRQGKTGTVLWVPFTDDLRAALDATKRVGLTICAQPNGLPTSYRGAADMIMDIRREIGAEKYDLHALRHTAAHELAALGCEDELIMAVTGHSSKSMVAHYAGAARQKARATKAQSLRDGK